MRRKLKSKDGHNKYSSWFKLVQSQFLSYKLYSSAFKNVFKKNNQKTKNTHFSDS